MSLDYINSRIVTATTTAERSYWMYRLKCKKSSSAHITWLAFIVTHLMVNPS